MIQTRNLNIDPEWYIKEMGLDGFRQERTGLANWLSIVHERFPWIKTGYFNPPRREMKVEHFEFG